MTKELPPGWISARLSQLSAADAPIMYGILQPGPDIPVGVPYVRPSEIQGDEIQLADVRRTSPEIAAQYKRASLMTGDVLLSIVGTIGKVAVVPKDLDGGNITQSSVRIRPAAGISGSFLRALLKSPQLVAQYNALRLGTGVPRLNVGDVRQLECPVPPLNEQRRIGAKLEALQARSRRAREALDAVPPLLEKLRQSILAAAFRGDLTKDWRAQNPNPEPASALLARIRTERRKKWEESELAKLKAKGKPPTDDRWKAKYKEPGPVDTTGLPALPDGWCWATWAEVGFCQNGRAFPSSEYTKTGTKLLRPGNLNVSGSLEWTEDNTRRMPTKWAAEFPEFVVRENELLMNLTAQSLKDEFLGRICLSSIGEECLLNQRIARLVPVFLPRRYWLYFFKSPEFRRFVDTLNTGSLIQHMFTSQLDACFVPLMPQSEADALVRAVDARLTATHAVADLVREHGTRLPLLDRSVLAKAFRGELVPQDPNDEPAEAMLSRLRSESASEPPRPRGRRSKAAE